MNHLCRVCGAVGDAPLQTAREQMFGTGECFQYFQCGACGCLQILDIPSDLGRYYPSSYYSLSADGGQHGRLRGLLMRLRDAAAVRGRDGLLGNALLKWKPHAPLQSLSHLVLRNDSRILDVGCGSGHLLRELRRLGFSDLTGVDPNVAADIVVDEALRIHKRHLEELEGRYDVIMFHHSLEHIPDQRAVLQAAHDRLAEGGTCLVRIPVVATHAWRTYGLDWVQLDAPRHLYLHSKASMDALARSTGFRVENVVFDSSEFQFWGSEAYREGVSLFDPQTGRPTSRSLAIASSNKAKWRAEARALNARGDGDQAVFLLRRVGDGTHNAVPVAA